MQDNVLEIIRRAVTTYFGLTKSINFTVYREQRVSPVFPLPRPVTRVLSSSLLKVCPTWNQVGMNLSQHTKRRLNNEAFGSRFGGGAAFLCDSDVKSSN